MKQRIWIPFMVDKYAIKSICDVGAGDLNWIQSMGLPLSLEYTALDLVPRHPLVKQFNVLTDPLPKADCLMAIWLLNHFTEAMARLAMGKLLKSEAKYLIYTYEPRMWDFTDLEAVESIVIRKRGDDRGNVEMRLVEL